MAVQHVALVAEGMWPAWRDVLLRLRPAVPGPSPIVSAKSLRGLAIRPSGGRVLLVSDDLVPDGLWELVAPLLPQRPPRCHRYPGRLPAADRAALRGIVHVLCECVRWRDAPPERAGSAG